MGFATAIVVFVIIWWVVLFAVLPWGVRRPENPGQGHEPGAPVNPRMWLKAGVTTAIAAVLWGVVYWAIAADWFSFRSP
jgi:predicted secreted protein